MQGTHTKCNTTRAMPGAMKCISLCCSLHGTQTPSPAGVLPTGAGKPTGVTLTGNDRTNPLGLAELPVATLELKQQSNMGRRNSSRCDQTTAIHPHTRRLGRHEFQVCHQHLSMNACLQEQRCVQWYKVHLLQWELTC